MKTSPIVPSFVAKINRAIKHLDDLEIAVDAYAATEPYAVTKRGERQDKQPIRRLVFTADPGNTDIPLIAADAIYNLRASLDHLMSAMVSSSKKSSPTFPIHWQDVWEPQVEGENSERRKARDRWRSDTRTLPDGAVAVLKRLQPPDDAGDGEEVHMLKVINALSNVDRHTKLAVFSAGLQGMTLCGEMPDGSVWRGGGSASAYAFTDDNAALFGIPEGAVNVQVKGAPLIAVRVRHKRRDATEGYVVIPVDLRWTVDWIEQDIVPSLIPFIRKAG